MAGCLKNLAITAGVGVFALIAVALFVSVIEGPKDDKPDEMDAFIYAEKAVESHLKAPSTAEFSSYNPANVTRASDTFYVKSYVDSQNGFGAMVRSRFEVRVIFVDDKIQTSILKFE